MLMILNKNKTFIGLQEKNIDFNSMSTHLELFYAYRLENCEIL